MKDTRRSNDWRILCELASKEIDPEKLIDLIMKINQALEECQQKSPFRVSATAYSHSVAPQLSQRVEYDC